MKAVFSSEASVDCQQNIGHYILGKLLFKIIVFKIENVKYSNNNFCNNFKINIMLYIINIGRG